MSWRCCPTAASGTSWSPTPRTRSSLRPATAHWLGAMADRPRRRCRDGDVPRDAARRSSLPRRWTATCRRTRQRVANVRRLRDDFGYTIVEPGDRVPSRAASRASAAWRSLPTIVEAVVAAVARPAGPGARDPAARPPRVDRIRDADLDGRHLVVTAGGTAEPIDPVRFIGNRSTGKMGVAIAEAALARGAE